MGKQGDVPENGGIEAGAHISVPGALDVGTDRQRIVGEQGSVEGELADIAQRRQEVETQFKRDVAYATAHLEIDLEGLEEERSPLTERKEELEAQVKSLEGRVGYMAGRLRSAANKPGALRGDQLLYAIFATQGDMSRSGLERLAAVDELVRENDGEVFAVMQNGHFSFGRIREGNEGLEIDARKETDKTGEIERIGLPVETYDAGEYAEENEVPVYGWLYEGDWDHVRRESKDDDRPDIEGWLSQFDIELSDLHIPHPTDLTIEKDFAGEVDIEEEFKEDGGKILVGEDAINYLHAFVDARLNQILNLPSQSRALRQAAFDELGRINTIALQLGIDVETSRLTAFKAAISK